MAECYDLPDCSNLSTPATCVVLIRSSKHCTPRTHELMIRGLTVMIIGPNTQLLLAVHHYISVTVDLLIFWRMNLRWEANGDDVQALWFDPCGHHQQAPRHKHGRGFVTRLSAPEKGMSTTQCPESWQGYLILFFHHFLVGDSRSLANSWQMNRIMKSEAALIHAWGRRV